MATDRIKVKVSVKNVYKYEAMSFTGYSTETRYIYTFADESEEVYVWKTSAFLAEKIRDDENGWETDSKGRTWRYDQIRRDDVITLTASVKGESEYKGTPQTVLTRVKLVERHSKGKTHEEIQKEKEDRIAAKAQEQLDSLKGEDFVWRMPYKQYKERYSDCETVAGSFRSRNAHEVAHISVIIREGRLKASGVRGLHYSGYEYFFVEDGEKVRVCYYAISETTAMRRLLKEHPTATDITEGKIYHYGN